jgi:uncharacterized protein YcbX
VAFGKSPSAAYDMDDEISLTLALFHHYVEYISAPGIAITLALVFGPLVYGILNDSKKSDTRKAAFVIPGCRRFGLPDGQSNLKDQYRRSADHPKDCSRQSTVKALFTYPIKSCRGVEVAVSEVEATGLKYDRAFTFAQLQSKQVDTGGAADSGTEWQHQWRFITAREHPRLSLLKTELWLPDSRLSVQARIGQHIRNASEESNDSTFGIGRSRSRDRRSTIVLESAGVAANKRRKSSLSLATSDWATNGGCLVVSFPFAPDWNPLGLRTEAVQIKIPLAPTVERAEAKQYTNADVTVWQDSPSAINMSNEVDTAAMEKLRYFLGVSNPLALFRRDESHLRSVTRHLPADLADGRFQIGFSDSYSAHVLSVASVRAVDAELPHNAPMKDKLDARRFRANIYLEGTEAFEEDDWQRVTMGRSFRATKAVDTHPGTTATDFGSGSDVHEAEWLFGCQTSRCTLPNVDPETSVKDNNEPYTTLHKMRKVDKHDSTAVLGMQIVPLFECGLISVGDEVSVLAG